jgi:hypothetical protein
MSVSKMPGLVWRGPIGLPDHSGRIRKSALGSRSCGLFCSEDAVDSLGVHDRLEKTEKMHKFNRFGVFCPPIRRAGAQAGQPA